MAGSRFRPSVCAQYPSRQTADGGGEVRCDALTPILLATIRAQRRLLARQDLQIRELAHRQLKVQALERRGNGHTDADDVPQGTTPSEPRRPP